MMKFRALASPCAVCHAGAIGLALALAMGLPSPAGAQAPLRAQSALVRQDFSDCSNSTVSGSDPARIGGDISISQSPNGDTTAIVTYEHGAPNTDYQVFFKCHGLLGTVATNAAGYGTGAFTFHADPGSKLAFDSYPAGAPAGNKFQSVAATPQAQSGAYRVLYSFRAAPDGRNPQSGLLDLGGVLFGTTMSGGNSGSGTVYTIDAAGAERVVASFDSASNGGFFPMSGLTALAFSYGTTERGGPAQSGTVYALSPALSRLYAFQGGTDGARPEGALLARGGALYGTTSQGGQGCGGLGCGVVFMLNLSGQEQVMYRFTGHADGGGPYAGLIDVNGTLYGSATFGGAAGSGVIFTITGGGQEQVVHSFAGGADGAKPMAPLLAVNGTLYGTTAQGGSANHGVVFSLGLDGSERVLHAFAGGSDGAYPRAGLTWMNGMFYGVTAEGGQFGKGVLFRLDPSGAETVLHSFGGPADGSSPGAELVAVGGVLYGTTPYGGDSGFGTVFTFTP